MELSENLTNLLDQYQSNPQNQMISQSHNSRHRGNQSNHSRHQSKKNNYQSKKKNFQPYIPNRSNFQLGLKDPNNKGINQLIPGIYQPNSERVFPNYGTQQQLNSIEQDILPQQNLVLQQPQSQLQPQPQPQPQKLIINQNQAVSNQTKKNDNFQQIKTLFSVYLINPLIFSKEAQKLILSMNQTKFIEEYFKYLTQCGDTKKTRDMIIEISKILNREKLIAKDAFLHGFIHF